MCVWGMAFDSNGLLYGKVGLSANQRGTRNTKTLANKPNNKKVNVMSNVYGVLNRSDCMVDISSSLKYSKKWATEAGFKNIYRRPDHSYNVDLCATCVNGVWFTRDKCKVFDVLVSDAPCEQETYACLSRYRVYAKSLRGAVLKVSNALKASLKEFEHSPTVVMYQNLESSTGVMFEEVHFNEDTDQAVVVL